PAGPAGASFSEDLGEFILPYEVVRGAHDPDAVLLEFLQATYDAAADTGNWDRAALDANKGSLPGLSAAERMASRRQCRRPWHTPARRSSCATGRSSGRRERPP